MSGPNREKHSFVDVDNKPQQQRPQIIIPAGLHVGYRVGHRGRKPRRRPDHRRTLCFHPVHLEFDHTVGRQTSPSSQHATQFVPGRSCPLRKLPAKQADKQAGLSRQHKDKTDKRSWNESEVRAKFFRVSVDLFDGLMVCMALGGCQFRGD
ncbi:hypothetical protein RRG08_012978 [Elysia crispata]|uniref:Uncharacterized protein n=1 Tax=Elysia crispata TaxID=231223 RepID=A0AAE1A1D6_9GAST|nr:hypothetical protein RRG08_012978 [Elysia crispata]